MQLLEEAIALDPGYAFAYSILSTAHFDLVIIGASESPRESLQRAVELGKKAIVLDDSNSHAHAYLTFPYIYLREYDKAIQRRKKPYPSTPIQQQPTGRWEPRSSWPVGLKKPFPCSRNPFVSAPFPYTAKSGCSGQFV